MKHIYWAGFLLSALTIAIPCNQSMPLPRANEILRITVEPGPTSAGGIEDVSTISFCEMIRNPQLYFGRLVRVKTTWARGYEGIYVKDPECPSPIIGYSSGEKQRWCDQMPQSLERMKQFGSQAEILVVGTLENKSRRGGFVSYDHLFVATCIEKVGPAKHKYEGFLDEGQVYRAEVRCDKARGLWPVIPLHQEATLTEVRIVWTNLSKYPALKKSPANNCQRRVIFQVLSARTMKVAGRERWRATYTCRIIEVE